MITRVLFTLCAILPANLALATTWNGTWWNPSTGTLVQGTDDLLRAQDIVVLGEAHYDAPTTNAEGAIIKRLATSDRPFLLGWEFLNNVDAPSIATTWQSFLGSNDSGKSVAGRLAGDDAQVYGPVFEALRSVGGALTPTNLTREQKDPVTAQGSSAADPALVPPGFAMGSDAYFQLFKAAMTSAGHPLPYPVENFFASQCLTDDVLAYSLLEASPKNARRALITGNFHGDYHYGAVGRLAIRAPEASRLYVHILNVEEMTEAEIRASFVDPVNGPIADVVYIVGEPKVGSGN